MREISRTRRDVSGLEAHLGYWMRYVSNAVSHGFQQKVQGKGVTVAEWVVLRELFDAKEAAPSAVAGRLRMTRGAISKLAERLSAKGLVRRRGDPNDARRQSLCLTARGRKLVPALAALADANDEEFFGHMRAAERDALITAMRDIVRRCGITEVPTT
jgi:DNA-binding MarR family transcriptional regulator